MCNQGLSLNAKYCGTQYLENHGNTLIFRLLTLMVDEMYKLQRVPLATSSVTMSIRLLEAIMSWSRKQEECIPVGCVPPACWPYPVVLGKGGVYPGGVCLEGCLPGRCLPRWGVCLGGVCRGGGVCPKEYRNTPPVDKILDTRLWKHYLPATTVAGGNKVLTFHSVTLVGCCSPMLIVYSRWRNWLGETVHPRPVTPSRREEPQTYGQINERTDLKFMVQACKCNNMREIAKNLSII